MPVQDGHLPAAAGPDETAVETGGGPAHLHVEVRLADLPAQERPFPEGDAPEVATPLRPEAIE